MGLARRDKISLVIASPIRADRTHRQARSISDRITGAKFPVHKDLDKFVFGNTTVDKGLVRKLATGSFLDAKRNAILSVALAPAKPVCISPGLQW